MSYRQKIDTFKELLGEIFYSYEYPHYQLTRHADGNFSLNKLYIKPNEASYKTELWELAPGVFDDVVRFYEFLETVDKKSAEESINDAIKKQGLK
jgi:hypothetical protein